MNCKIGDYVVNSLFETVYSRVGVDEIVNIDGSQIQLSSGVTVFTGFANGYRFATKKEITKYKLKEIFVNK
jgi:hypothetical protein